MQDPWPALLEALPYRKDDVLPNAERFELVVDVDEDGERLATRRWAREVPRKLQ